MAFNYAEVQKSAREFSHGLDLSTPDCDCMVLAECCSLFLSCQFVSSESDRQKNVCNFSEKSGC